MLAMCFFMCYINLYNNKTEVLNMQQLKTITVKTSNKVESVHVNTLYKVIENCFNNLQIMEADCTSASYFINSANIFAQLQQLYCENETSNYVSIESVMQVFSNNITFYDESCLFTSVVENTAMQNINIENYICMHN